MVKIGQRNILTVTRKVDFGLYLDGGNGLEILLPARYINDGMQIGTEVDVFVYTDSEDRIIATTEHPYAMAGEVAFLKVVAVNRIGAFLDWGLMKDLLVPFREQKSTMRVGGIYPVYVYLDDASKRVVATAKIEKYIGNAMPRYKRGDKVNAIVWKTTPLGMACVVENMHSGMLYANETFCKLEPGMKIEAWIRRVRPDGKIDLRLSAPASGRSRTEQLANDILRMLQDEGGRIELNDKSSPELIKEVMQCSKRDFKQAVGHLLKSGKIVQTDEGLSLLND